MVKIKEKLIAHIESIRPYTVLWCGLVSLIGACITYQGFPPIKISFLVFTIPLMGWIAGLYLSDYLDRKLDQIQKPHRPIPSGKIYPNEALFIGGIFAFSGFILSFLLGINNVLLVFIVAILVFTYAKISKSHGIFGNFNRGLVTSVAYVYGILAINKSFELIPLYVWLLTIVFFIHDTNSNLVGAIRDVKGDQEGGYSTIPVRYGIKKSIIIALVLSIIYYSMLFYLIFKYDFILYLRSFYLMILLSILILIIMYIMLFKSIKKITRKKALLAHELFIAERITIACAFLFGMISQILIPIIIFVISITITLSTQYLIRKRYEFMEKI